jgi:hypothetical protein
VTNALLLLQIACTKIVGRSIDLMKNTTPMRIKIRRFITDRYAYRTRPDFLPELVAFGFVLAVVSWPMMLLVNAVASSLR